MQLCCCDVFKKIFMCFETKNETIYQKDIHSTTIIDQKQNPLYNPTINITLEKDLLSSRFNEHVDDIDRQISVSPFDDCDLSIIDSISDGNNNSDSDSDNNRRV